MAKPRTLTQERLKELLYYDMDTGHFWRVKPMPGRKVGTVAGFITVGGGRDIPYIKVSIDNVEHRAHRLAWFYVTGEWPPSQIDHVNGDTLDNAWDNLRLAENWQNAANKGALANNTAGFKGVTRSNCRSRERWRAHITVRNKRRCLGTYDTKVEAHRAYCRAARKYFGEYARYE